MRIDQDLGPAPTPPVPSSLSAARRKVLLVVAGAGERGVTVVQVADELGGHPNGARAHLEALAEDGLVSVENIESGSRGRPARCYAVTPVGRRALGESGDDSYRSLSQAFARYVATNGDAEEARKIGLMWAEMLANDQTVRDGGLVGLLSALGFSPVGETPTDERPQTVQLHTCPLLSEARDNPEVVCAIHEGLIAGSLAHWGRPGRVRLEPFSGPGMCSLRIDPPNEEQS